MGFSKGSCRHGFFIEGIPSGVRSVEEKVTPKLRTETVRDRRTKDWSMDWTDSWDEE